MSAGSDCSHLNTPTSAPLLVLTFVRYSDFVPLHSCRAVCNSWMLLHQTVRRLEEAKRLSGTSVSDGHRAENELGLLMLDQLAR
jgi:hypothetical protein